MKEVDKKDNLIQEAAEQFEYTNGIYGFKEGVKWQKKRSDWKTVSEQTPPDSIQVLVQDPYGKYYLTSWRKSYSIFSCQEKTESSIDWKWKPIN